MNFRAPVEYQRGEQARKGGRDSKAKFKDRKVWTVAVGRRSASARFQIRRSPGECTSIQIYRRRVHCTHAFPRLRDSRAFQRSERCIIIGASALSIRGNPENNPKKSGFHGFMTPFYEFTSAPLQPTLPFPSLLCFLSYSISLCRTSNVWYISSYPATTVRIRAHRGVLRTVLCP